MREDEMVGWHHRLDGHELWKIVKDREACLVAHVVAESDTTEQQLLKWWEMYSFYLP